MFAGVSDPIILDLLLLPMLRLQEIARETAEAEVAKLTQDMDEVMGVAVEKDETIEKLKEELSARSAKAVAEGGGRRCGCRGEERATVAWAVEAYS